MSDPIAPLIKALHAQGRLRVWSLVITVFGDLVQHRGGEISTARLGLLLGRAGVEQGALRTALSRLGRDGWVASTRAGRTSLYRLSPEGQKRFAPATTRIYAPPCPAATDRWTIAIGLDGAGGQTVQLQPAGAAPEAADLTLTGTIGQISDAYRDALLSAGHRAALAGLAADLETLAAADLGEPLDAAVARMLLIHRWRRITLRYSDIAPPLMPEGAPLRDPRAAVAAAYAALAPAAERWLDSAPGGLDPMPAADDGFARRFSGLHQA